MSWSDGNGDGDDDDDDDASPREGPCVGRLRTAERHQQRQEGERRKRVGNQGRQGGRVWHRHGRPPPLAAVAVVIVVIIHRCPSPPPS